MPSPDQQQRLAALRETIADIERKPALAEARAMVEVNHDSFPVLQGGLLQEIFTDAARNGGASLAFALGQAKGLLTPRRIVVLYLQLVGDAQFFGVPYGPGLLTLGFDPARMVVVRTTSMIDLLWVAEEALTCRAVAGIVLDVGGETEPLDFTASRRLSLRAVQSGISLFVLRYGSEREASAAHLRWHLSPHRSGRKRFDATAPGAARWLVRLEKGVPDKQSSEWFLEWKGDGFATFSVQSTIHHRSERKPAFPGSVSTLLGDRLSETA
jgi:protein ImuA